MFRAMAIRRFLCSIVALESSDILLSCSVITNNNIIAHNHHTNNNPYIFLHLSTFFYTSTSLHLQYLHLQWHNVNRYSGPPERPFIPLESRGEKNEDTQFIHAALSRQQSAGAEEGVAHSVHQKRGSIER